MHRRGRTEALRSERCPKAASVIVYLKVFPIIWLQSDFTNVFEGYRCCTLFQCGAQFPLSFTTQEFISAQLQLSVLTKANVFLLLQNTRIRRRCAKASFVKMQQNRKHLRFSKRWWNLHFTFQKSSMVERLLKVEGSPADSGVSKKSSDMTLV